MTRQEIRNLARKRLGETTTSFWTDAQLNTWINDGGYDLAFRTKSIRSNTTFNTTDGQIEYTISTSVATNVLAILDVWFKVTSNTWTKMDLFPREEMDTRYPTWRSTSSGTPSKAFFDIEDDVLGLHAPPGASPSYTAATIAFVASTPATITDSASAFVTEEFAAGQTLTVTGTTSNNGTYTIASVVVGAITLVSGDTLTAEASGSQFTLTSTLQARVYYAEEYTALTADSGESGLPEFLHLAQCHYVVATGQESRGWGDKANNTWQMYENAISRYLGSRMLDKDHREATEVAAGKVTK